MRRTIHEFTRNTTKRFVLFRVVSWIVLLRHAVSQIPLSHPADLPFDYPTPTQSKIGIQAFQNREYHRFALPTESLYLSRFERLEEKVGAVMPRYIVERSYPEGLKIPVNDEGAEICRMVVMTNDEESVTWIQSYVSEDGKKSFCAYDAPSPEAIRRTARRNNLPVDRITQVRVLDPYFYR